MLVTSADIYPELRHPLHQFLAEGSLAAYRVQGDQKQGLQQSLRWNRGSAYPRVHAVEVVGHTGEYIVGDLLDGSERVVWAALIRRG